MKCSVFIATSVDGFIAKEDGSTDWLHTAGNTDQQDMASVDMGWDSFINSVDCVVMGRKCIDSLLKMGVKPQNWIYGDLRVVVLSNTLKEVPEHLQGYIELYSGELKALVDKLESEGHKHAYIDGGQTIQSFIKDKLMTEMSITRAPILLGTGVPLFGSKTKGVELMEAEAKAFPNDFVQVKYTVKYK